MSHTRSWLAGLLALQLAVAGLLAWQHGTGSGVAASEPLLTLQAGDIDRLVIDTGDASVTLEHADGNWRLPELDGLPVSQGSVETLLEQLVALRGGWPVATTEASHPRFAVAADDFRKRLRLYSGDTLAAELYLGEAAGLRQTHLRLASDSAVYKASVDTYAVYPSAEGWLDKSLLAVSEPTAIRGPDYAIEKHSDSWQFSDAGAALAGAALAGDDPAAGAIDAQALASLTDTLGSLRVQGVATRPESPPQLTLEVGTSAGSYQFRLWQQDGEYLLQRDDRDSVFSLGQYQFEQLAGIDRAALAGTGSAGNGDSLAHSESAEGGES
jgi:hypothetical protein